VNTSSPAAGSRARFQIIRLANGGELLLCQTWLTSAAAAAYLAELQASVPWRQETIRIAGRAIVQPRLSCWVGDADAVYVYSGLTNRPMPWTPALARLRHQLEYELGCSFNSVLANYYRSEQDAMGWHADNERELGDQPTIASISVGAARRFVLRHKRRKQERVELELQSGSLLVMTGSTQQFYKHAVPRQRAPAGSRINLTYRLVLPPAQPAG
jgi:alkylated DNA repair dioxygenase AlkB